MCANVVSAGSGIESADSGSGSMGVIEAGSGSSSVNAGSTGMSSAGSDSGMSASACSWEGVSLKMVSGSVASCSASPPFGKAGGNARASSAPFPSESAGIDFQKASSAVASCWRSSPSSESRRRISSHNSPLMPSMFVSCWPMCVRISSSFCPRC